MHRSLEIALWALAALLALALQLFVGAPAGRPLLSAVFDAGHAPLYGLVALAALRLVSGRPAIARSPRGRDYVGAGALALCLGGGVELVQYFGPRNADFADLGRNALGIAGVLLVAAGWERRAPRRATAHLATPAVPRGGRALLRMLPGLLPGVTLFAVAALPVAHVALAYRARDAAFPLLYDFEQRWEGTFLATRDARLDRCPAPDDWRGTRRGRVARVVYAPGPYPALLLNAPAPDWRGYAQLRFDVYAPPPDSFRLWLRVDTKPAGIEGTAQSTRPIWIRPGAHQLAIPLAELAAPGDEAPGLELGRVRSLALFLDHPSDTTTIYFDRVRLGPR